jgi:predicted esterase
MIQTIVDQGSWTPKKIFLMGFSEGANVIFNVLLQTQFHFGGAILVCGLLLKETLDQKIKIGSLFGQIPILLNVGDSDPHLRTEELSTMMSIIHTEIKNHSIRTKKYAKKQQMFSSKEETRDFFEFISKLLCLRSISLENAPGVYQVKLS